jgi:hypothetical protein
MNCNNPAWKGIDLSMAFAYDLGEMYHSLGGMLKVSYQGALHFRKNE